MIQNFGMDPQAVNLTPPTDQPPSYLVDPAVRFSKEDIAELLVQRPRLMVQMPVPTVTETPRVSPDVYADETATAGGLLKAKELFKEDNGRAPKSVGMSRCAYDKLCYRMFGLPPHSRVRPNYFFGMRVVTLP